MPHFLHRREFSGSLVSTLLAALLAGAPEAIAMSRGKAPVQVPVAGDQSLVTLGKSFRYTAEREQNDLILRKGATSLRVTNGSRKLKAGGVLVWLNRGVTVRKKSWRVENVDADKTLLPMLKPAPFLERRGYRTIVLDPGHGGGDPGAISATGLKEKTITLDIARHMKTHLENAGYRVILTRSDDRGVQLKDRAAKARAVNADLFVSIHCNAAPGNRTAGGVETFVLSIPGYNSTNDPKGFQPSRATYPGNAFDGANMILGYSLQKALVGETPADDRGLRRARFLVLKELSCPGALVECGFLSNPKEAGRLSVPYYRQKIALSLARGIDNYLGEVKKAVASQTAPVTKK